MKDFSKLNNSQTGKDRLINQMVSSTGLSKEKVEQLYQSFDMTAQGDLTKINESFVSFVTQDSISKSNFENFQNTIFELATKLSKPQMTLNERAQITDSMIAAINDLTGLTPDTPALLEIVCYVLLLKNKKFEKVSKEIQFGLKTKDLFESEKVDFSKINVIKENNIEDNKINANEDKRLYESLKVILAKNNNRWGYNYHLDNAYKTIVDYLDTEIQNIVSMDNIHTMENTFEMELIQQMISTEQLNPMYRQVDVLRKLIPDIQTLTFDLMLLVHNYISSNSFLIQFVARTTYLEYIDTTKILYSAISSSLETSKIAAKKQRIIQNVPEDIQGTSNDPIPGTYTSACNGSGYSQIFDNFSIDLRKVDLSAYPVQLKTAVDCIHIIKSCENEFNLRLRKIINLYVTKSLNLLASTEHILLEQRKSNKFKSGF
jgi:hypothetical protein